VGTAAAPPSEWCRICWYWRSVYQCLIIRIRFGVIGVIGVISVIGVSSIC